jgi:hypothetical protein
MINGCTTLADYIQRYQVDGVMWKAKQLLDNIDNPLLRNEKIEEIAHMLALIPKPVAREDYAKRIGKEYNVSWPTFKKIIDEHVAIGKRMNDTRLLVRKNKVNKLEGDARTWPFFMEVVTERNGDEIFKGVEIDLEKFIALLGSFGYTRYETASVMPNSRDDQFAFVMLNDNVISNVSRQQIIDYIENFIRKDYDFSRFHHVDSSVLLNKFYKQMKTLFSKDLFARVRNDAPIIINRDTHDKAYFYYQNGFVEVTAEGRRVLPYDQMEGSVWDTQMQARNFKLVDLESNDPEKVAMPYGVFADFVFRISGQKASRYESLISIIGYLVHDYYEYKLRAVVLTDSSLSEASEGRTGKTLLMKMLNYVRSQTEINGKDFDSGNKNKYEDVTLGSQMIHLNDVKTRGKFKFDFEDVFNDVTEGVVVNAKYMTPFRKICKIAITINKTLNIIGASQRDRVVEFEMSDFFGETLSPQQHYGQWFGSDWDEDEWNRFDNFICICVQKFLKDGIVFPETINLEARKLMNHTAQEFLDFMEDCTAGVKLNGLPFDTYQVHNGMFEKQLVFEQFEFDKKQLYEKFVILNHDFKSWLTSKKFIEWLRQYSALKLGVKHPREWRSNGNGYIQFKAEA